MNNEAAAASGNVAGASVNESAPLSFGAQAMQTEAAPGGPEDQPFEAEAVTAKAQANGAASTADDPLSEKGVADSVRQASADAAGSGSGAKAEPAEKHLGGIDVRKNQFTPLESEEINARTDGNLTMLMDLELPVAVELGRISMQVKDILELGPGAVVELNKFSGEPVEIYVNAKKFAEGEVVVVEQNFGVRITALVGPNEKLGHLQ